MKQFMQDINNKIDIEGLKMYLYINEMVKKNKWGFDLYRTSDCVTFQTITKNGFGDKYNYGCPSFLATKEGLYIGTCNPFYGGQLYLLTNVADRAHEEGDSTKNHDHDRHDDAYDNSLPSFGVTIKSKYGILTTSLSEDISAQYVLSILAKYSAVTQLQVPPIKS